VKALLRRTFVRRWLYRPWPVRIEKLDTLVLEARLDRPIQFGVGPYGAFTATVVEITTDDGITGVGECIARKAPRVVDTVLRDLLWPIVQGRDPRDVEGLWDEMFGQLRAWGHYRGFVQEAMSGIDQALWDILARAQGIPLYKALAGAGRPRVPCYASSVYFADLPQMARETEQQVAAGHTAVKMKIGRSAGLGGTRMDVESVRVCREAAGPGVELMADVNSAYDAATAIRVCHAIEPYDLAFLEEPVFPDDHAGYELIRRSQSIPLAAGESEFGVFGFRDLFARRAIDVAQPEIARIGGFTAARRLGALVHAHNLKVAPHTGFSCGVAHLASLHLAAAVPNLARFEYMFIDNPLRDIFREGFPQPQGGFITLPEGAGLGLELDRKKLERFRLN
jgi:D-galactarolactone cycloisomerase